MCRRNDKLVLEMFPQFGLVFPSHSLFYLFYWLYLYGCWVTALIEESPTVEFAAVLYAFLLHFSQPLLFLRWCVGVLALLLTYMSSVSMAYSLVCLPQHSLSGMMHCNTACETTNLFTLVELLNIRVILCSRTRY